MIRRQFTKGLILICTSLLFFGCIKEEVRYPIASNRVNDATMLNYQMMPNGEEWFVIEHQDNEAFVCKKDGEVLVFDGDSRAFAQPNRKHITQGNKGIVSTGSYARKQYFLEASDYDDFDALEEIQFPGGTLSFINYDSYSGQDMFAGVHDGKVFYAFWNGSEFESVHTTVPDCKVCYISLDPQIGVWAQNGTKFYQYKNNNLQDFNTSIYNDYEKGARNSQGIVYGIDNHGDVILFRDGQIPSKSTIYGGGYGFNDIAVDHYNNVWLVKGGELFRKTPNGYSFERVNSVHLSLRKVFAGENYDHLYLLTDYGTLYRLYNNQLESILI